MSQQHQLLDQRLKEFRKKFYTDKLIKGTIIFFLLVLSILLLMILSEGFFGFSSKVRTAMVWILSLSALGILGYMIVWPLSQLFNFSKTINDFQIANLVKNHFPDINDKLINFLQLRGQTSQSNLLIQAALDKKAADIAPISLSSAIDLKQNGKRARYLVIPLLILLLGWVAYPKFMNTSGERLINYDKEFLPPAPFAIQINDLPVTFIAGQTYDIEVELNDVSELPSELFMYIKRNSEQQFLDYNLKQDDKTHFTFTFSDVKEDFSFYVGNPEVKTSSYNVHVVKRPFIKDFQATIFYPSYTGLKPERLDPNIGDFKAIKGSTVQWELDPQGDIQEASFVINDSTRYEFKEEREGYVFKRRLSESIDYYLGLTSNENIRNADTVKYRATIFPDRYPSVYTYSSNTDFLIDLDTSMPLDLEIADDYGFSQLRLMYRFTKSGGTSEVSEKYFSYPLEFSRDVLVQPLSFQIDLTALGLREGDELEYYLEVFDNDQVSGPKSSKSGVFKAVYPTLDEKYDELSGEQEEVKEELESMERKARELQEAYQKMQEKLLDKKRLNFDDKKELNKIMEEHQQMMQDLESAQEKFEETKDRLTENQMISPQTQQKFEELNEYMEQLKDSELEKMLQEMLEQMENLNSEDIKNKLEQLQKNDKSLQKSLERTLELLKQLEAQQKVDELRNKIDNLKDKQDLLKDKLDNAKSEKDLEQTAERQEELFKQMDKIKEDLEKLDQLKKQTRTPEDGLMNKLEDEADITQKEMKNAAELMKEAAEEKENESGDGEQGESGEQKESEQEGKSGEEKQEGGDQENAEGEQGENEKQEGEQEGEQGEKGEQEEQQESENSEGGEQSESQNQQGQQQQSQQGQSSQQSPQQQKAGKSQKNASQQLQQMSEQLSGMQSGMQMQQDQQNLENLRELLENLLTLSFDQEGLRDEVRKLKYGDPSLREKSQEQKKLQDDMELVADSLESLANKVFAIKKDILDESEKIQESMQRSQAFFRNKQISMIEYHQQTAMTSINNLANMLSGIMKQMQQSMMSGMPAGMNQKPGQNQGMQQMSEMQRQLNEKLQQMMNQMNQGSQIDSEKLQQMAAEQEAIRQQLQEAHEKIQKEGGKALGNMDKIMNDMKDSETELRNKQLTHETLMRQQQILSRLLQADKSVRQRELDDKRESRSGKERERKSPDALTEDELQNKIRQELLKTNKLEYSNDFIILIEQYYKQLEEKKP